MKNVAIITNIPAPYRVDFFHYLKNNYGNEYKFTIIYSSQNEDNRKWDIDAEKMTNSVFLQSKTVKIKKRYDTKYIHFPVGCGKVLAEIKPDVVVASEYNPTVIQALLFCKKNNIPFVSWTDGTLHSERNINVVQKILRKFVISNAKAYIASSTKSKEAQMFYGADESKIHISYLTVDVDKYIQEPKGDGSGKILYVGSLIERKGVDLLFNALKEIKYGYTLFIAGEGSEKDILIEQSKELGINEKVVFLGHQNNEQLLTLYSESDFFVLPTREDCFALVILEALCSNLPVICSKYADGVYDLIIEGKNGYIVDPNDAKLFAEKIIKLLTDRSLRESMQENSKNIIDKFMFKNTAIGFIEAIEEVYKII